MTGRSATISRTASSARASRSRSTTCSAPATPSCPASCAAGWAARPLATSRDLGQCLRRLRRVAAALLAGISDLRGAAVLPEERQHASGAAQGRGDQPRPLGDDAPPRHPVADGAGHRPSRRSSRTSPRKAGADAKRIRAFKVLAVKAAAQVADGRPGYGMLIDEKYRPRGDVRVRRAIRSPGSAGRSSCRARGRCASSSARTSARSWSNGRSTTASSACASTIPDDPADAEERAAARSCARCSRPRARSAANC